MQQTSSMIYDSIPDSRYTHPRTPGGPLPFRSRDAANQVALIHPQEHGVKWQDLDSHSNPIHENAGTDRCRLSSSNKENVESWLETTSPTSVIEQAQSERDPPSPSPICSPSPSSPISSPHPTISSSKRSAAPSSELPNNVIIPSGDDGPSSSRGKRHGKEIVLSSSAHAPPESPTGSSFSSGSEGGLLALLASKLFSHKENSRFSSRYARERSGPIDDKHVMEDRARKPPVDETLIRENPQTDRSINPDQNLQRATSLGTLSELSLGSANDRTLSMEFDAMLAAAVVAGVRQANTLEGQGRSTATVDESTHRDELPGIEEDHSFSSSPAVASTAAVYGDDRNLRGSERARERTGIEGWIVAASAQSGDTDSAAGIYDALTATRRGRAESEDMDIATHGISEMHLSSRSSSRGSRRAESDQGRQIVTTSNALPQSSTNSRTSSSASSSNGIHRDSLALVLVNDQPLETTSSRFCSPKVAAISQENIVSNPTTQTLEKVRRDKTLARAIAYQDAKNSQYNNRYMREETKINAWENQQKIKATINMRKVEMKLEQKRAKALEKMQNEIALAHKKAEERKASAEAVRGMKLSKAAEVANNIKKTGKVPSGCLPF